MADIFDMKYSLNAVLKLFEMQSKVGFKASQIIIKKKDKFFFLDVNTFEAAINAKFESIIESPIAKQELNNSLNDYLKMTEDIMNIFKYLPHEPEMDKLKYVIYCTPNNIDINTTLGNEYLVGKRDKIFPLGYLDQRQIENEQINFDTSVYKQINTSNKHQILETYKNFSFLFPSEIYHRVKEIDRFLKSTIQPKKNVPKVVRKKHLLNI